MLRGSLPSLLFLYLSLGLVLTRCIASPSFKFIKGFSTPHDDTPAFNNANSTAVNVWRNCPSSVKNKDISMERKLKHSIDQIKSQKAVAYPVITIPVVLHVVQSSGKLLVKDGYISPAQFTQQIRILNQDFAKANINFRIQGMRHVINARWFNGVGYMNALSKEMRRKTREGDRKTLNIWTTSFSTVTTTFGYGAFPWDANTNLSDDGVTMATEVFFGGTNKQFNDGRYLTHEIGHWAGLYHTFEGESCSGSGDYVDDTPAQASPSDFRDNSCKSTDTCPSVAGLDAITNFMDYSNSGCQNQFTNGQVHRMRAALNQFRRYPLIPS